MQCAHWFPKSEVCPWEKVIACSNSVFYAFGCVLHLLGAYAVAMEIQFSQLQDISIVVCLHIQLLAVSAL